MMNRRRLLQAGAAVAPVVPSLIPSARAEGLAPSAGAWRAYEMSTRVSVPVQDGPARAWIPLPSVRETAWIQPLGNTWRGNSTQARVERDPIYGAEMLAVEWAPGDAAREVEVISRFATRDRVADLSAPPASAAELSAEERALNLAATNRIPVDGIVLETANRIVAGRTGEIEKVHAIYEWIVQNTYRDPATRGCGDGDIVGFLQKGTLGGKCADLNPLFVALNRAVGIPARDLYGIRVAPSAFGYKSLGPKGEVVSGAQHCRAEVFLSGYGWVAMDPADVRKVMLEEAPGGLGFDDPRVASARQVLFGSWEGNWVPFNSAHDVVLPGSAQPPIAFLMYPQVETGSGRLDCLDAKAGGYTITARPISI